MLAVLFGMTFGAWRRLKRGDLGRYLVTAASVPALIVYLAVANAGPIVGAVFGKQDRVQPHAQGGHVIGRSSPPWRCCSPPSSAPAACCWPPSSAACSTWWSCTIA